MTRWIGIKDHGELVRDTETDVAPVQHGVRFVQVENTAPIHIGTQYWEGRNFSSKGVGGPHQVFDYYTRKWVDFRDIEAEWAVVRHKRDNALLACDWTQLPDVPSATKEAWATYRQSLRDITDQPDPFNIVWPTPPVT